MMKMIDKEVLKNMDEYQLGMLLASGLRGDDYKAVFAEFMKKRQQSRTG